MIYNMVKNCYGTFTTKTQIDLSELFTFGQEEEFLTLRQKNQDGIDLTEKELDILDFYLNIIRQESSYYPSEVIDADAEDFDWWLSEDTVTRG